MVLFRILFYCEHIFKQSSLNCKRHIQVILFEIDCAIFYENLHELFCQYSEVPNRRADRIKQAGLEKNTTLPAFLLSKLINMKNCEPGGKKI